MSALANQGNTHQNSDELTRQLPDIKTKKAAVIEAKQMMINLWEPWSGSPASLIKTANYVVDCWDAGRDPMENPPEFLGNNISRFNATGNFLTRLKGIVGFTDMYGQPKHIVLTEDEKRVGQAHILDLQMNGLLHGIHTSRWGIDIILKKAGENGVNLNELLDWSPEMGVKDTSDKGGFLEDWKKELPEYIVDGKQPTLRQLIKIMDDTIRRYETSRLRTLGVYPKETA